MGIGAHRGPRCTGWMLSCHAEFQKVERDCFADARNDKHTGVIARAKPVAISQVRNRLRDLINCMEFKKMRIGIDC
jgi:hypothetical protein